MMAEKQFNIDFANVKEFVDQVKPPSLPQLPPPSFTRIKQIDFELFRPKEISALSHVEITDRKLKVFGTTTPFPHGVLDKSLGIYIYIYI